MGQGMGGVRPETDLLTKEPPVESVAVEGGEDPRMDFAEEFARATDFNGIMVALGHRIKAADVRGVLQTVEGEILVAEELTRIQDRLARFGVKLEVAPENGVSHPVEDRLQAVFEACARALGLEEGAFVADRDCPLAFKVFWERRQAAIAQAAAEREIAVRQAAERLQAQRREILPRLQALFQGLCSEQKHQARRGSSDYHGWQVAAVGRVAQVLGCKNDLQVVRAACATLMGVEVDALSGTVQVAVLGDSEPLNFFIPRFLSQGFVDAAGVGRPIDGQAAPVDVDGLLAHMKANPPRKVTAGPGGRRGGKRIKS